MNRKRDKTAGFGMVVMILSHILYIVSNYFSYRDRKCSLEIALKQSGFVADGFVLVHLNQVSYIPIEFSNFSERTSNNIVITMLLYFFCIYKL